MFLNQPYDFEAYSDFCFKTYGIRPNYNYTLTVMGGRNDKELQ